MLVSMSLPLTLSRILVGPGPMATALVLPSAASATGSSAGTAVKVVAAAATPVPRKNSRRENPGPFLLFPCGSFIAVDPPLVGSESFGEPPGLTPGAPPPIGGEDCKSAARREQEFCGR